MKTDDLREKYLEFFVEKGHTRRASDVLVPTWDSSVLFTPAGMNQFKPHFLGKVKLEFTRATTCQKCLRTGDIENVGRTAYHHTFFEMLGNFSFGDYFKREAIHWAWEFLTDKRWLGIDPQRLSVSVYLDDDEAAKIWTRDIKLPASRIERLGESENFWPASSPSEGPDGVCGPCSEIFFHGDDGKAVEIWNLVFTQFNRVGAPPNNLRPLPSKNIDTGMGMERIASVMQGVTTNYHIDILRPIVEAAAEVCGVKYDPANENGRRLRRITDHIRACTFAIHENVIPGPQEERYVVKRLLRRAVLDGHQMGLRGPFLYQLVPAVAAMMKAPYPELGETTERVARVVRQEEENFFGTIDAGLARIEQIFASMQAQHRNLIEGGEAATLYQTFGVPAELFASMAAERNLIFDWDGYRTAMIEHGDRSRGERPEELFATGPIEALKRAIHLTTFVGYDATETTAEIKGIIAQEHLVDRLQEVSHDKTVCVVLDRSPFYGESGGQVGDSGEIVGDGFRFVVTDTKKDDDLLVHYGHLASGVMTTGATVTARVDGPRRQAIRRAHSATHLLHHALRKNLGGHAQQQGSKVDADWLRFDFANPAAVEAQQLAAIEHDVAAKVAVAAPVEAKTLPLSEAREAGAMMLFGEKYPDPVRMVSMGDFSRELCGGIHLSNTSEVGEFEIVSEESVSAGTRRIVALTGQRARDHAAQSSAAVAKAAAAVGVARGQIPAAAAALARQVRDLKKHLGGSDKAPDAPDLEALPTVDAPDRTLLAEAASALRVAPLDVPDRLAALVAEVKSLSEQLTSRAAAPLITAEGLLEVAETVGNARMIVADVAGSNPNQMRQLIDQLRKHASPIAIFLATAAEDKVMLVAGVSQDLEARGADAGRWVREIAPLVGGSGGGKASLAQAGGKHPERLTEALAEARRVGLEMLK
ncbi:MAG: alanine--tRNA ligase [Planctomycetia bacterium]|nr:alanine--tRNA ligase [Planctomycetia bacterium]